MLETVLQFRFIVKSGRLIIADPSVFEDTNNAVKLNKVRKGIWMVHFTFDTLGYLERVIARHEKASILLARQTTKEVEVFSGQFGLFDAAVYRKDDLVIGMPLEPYETQNKGDLWYCAMCHITNHAPQGCGTFGFGVVGDTISTSHRVVSKKSWDGECVEVEVMKSIGT